VIFSIQLPLFKKCARSVLPNRCELSLQGVRNVRLYDRKLMYTLLFCRFSYCFVYSGLKRKIARFLQALSVPILIIEETVTAMYFLIYELVVIFARMNKLNIGLVLWRNNYFSGQINDSLRVAYIQVYSVFRHSFQIVLRWIDNRGQESCALPFILE